MMELAGRSAASLLPPSFAIRRFIRSPVAPVYLLIDQWRSDMTVGTAPIAKFRNLVIWPISSIGDPDALGVCIMTTAVARVACGGHCMKIDESIHNTSHWDSSDLIVVIRGPYGTLIINKVLCKDWVELAEKIEVI